MKRSSSDRRPLKQQRPQETRSGDRKGEVEAESSCILNENGYHSRSIALSQLQRQPEGVSPFGGANAGLASGGLSPVEARPKWAGRSNSLPRVRRLSPHVALH